MHHHKTGGWLLRAAIAVIASMLAMPAIAAQQAAASARQQTPAPGQPQEPAPAGEQSPADTSSQVLHILVGHSVVIRVEVRLTRVLIGNPAVITTTTTAPNELVVTATAAGSSSLVLWQDNGQSRIIEVFADVDISMLRDAIQRGFPGESIQVEAEENRVVLSGTASSAAVAEQMAKMAGSFSKDVVSSIHVGAPAREKQVLLKVRFAEVDRSRLESFGINIFSTGAANTLGTVSTQQFGGFGLGQGAINQGAQGSTTTTTTATTTTNTSASFTISDLLNIFIFRPDINLGATLRDLQNNNVLQILAEPNLMAMSGQPAQFLAGGELPYPMVQPAGAGGVSTVTVQFRPFGVRLDFTGTIESNNTVRLKVAPEVSSLDFANAVTIGGFVLPAISTRRAETTVELKDGQSFGIAGLLDRRTTVQMSKVPGFADLPIIGQLFRSKSISRNNTELMVIVTPSIVDPLAATMPEPTLPTMPIKPLDPGAFDKKLPKGPFRK